MHTTLAELEAEVFQADSSVRPSAVVVLCHGFGAPGDDLVPLGAGLARIAPALRTVRFIFPSGPLRLSEEWDARAWWPLQMDVVARLQTADDAAVEVFHRAEPEGLAAARRSLKAAIELALQQTGLPFSKLVVGGFSQGAMLATEVALRLEESPRGLAVLSGTVINEALWQQRLALKAGLRVFQSHGAHDQVLPFDGALRLKRLFEAANTQLTFVADQGGHGIEPSALEGFAAFLLEALR